jgi:hypothetical protein
MVQVQVAGRNLDIGRFDLPIFLVLEHERKDVLTPALESPNNLQSEGFVIIVPFTIARLASEFPRKQQVVILSSRLVRQFDGTRRSIATVKAADCNLGDICWQARRR